MTLSARASMTAMAAVWLWGGALSAQVGNRSSAQSPYYGSVTMVRPTTATIPLSLDDAIRMGIEHNLALVLARKQEDAARAQTLERLQPLLPAVTAQADTGAHQFNLAADGFSGKLLGKIAPLFPGENFSGISTVVKVDVTDALLNYSQSLFNLASLDEYRASKARAQAAYYDTQSSRGLVVLNVGTAYLQALASAAQVENANALLKTGQRLLDQATAKHRAGTAANLDELRARVQFQNRQLGVITAENDYAKAKIALNREIGLPPEQEIRMTDATPYAGLAAIGIAEAKQTAYQNRQDYQGLLARLRAAQLEMKAAKWERLPSLDFAGNYGVTGVTHGLYHGTFVAQGTLRVPIFSEAKFRGDRDLAASNLAAVTEDLLDLKRKIDQQLRESMLDLQSTAALVEVARSNLSLAQLEVEQTMERFQAGVDDDLPVVQAQAALAAAESNLVSTATQYNQAKLTLARNLGIVDTQYRTFLKGR